MIQGLLAGSQYSFDVQSIYQGNDSTAATSNTVTISAGCTSAQVCVAVDATANDGTALHRAAGLLHGDGSGGVVPPSLVTPLDLQQWRVTIGDPNCSGSENCTGYGPANALQSLPPVSETEVLSDTWFNNTVNDFLECGNQLNCTLGNYPTPYKGAVTPWSNWGNYNTFIKGNIQDVINTGMSNSGAKIQWWDLLNEPPSVDTSTVKNDTYFDYNDASVLTASNLEAWISNTYNDVKQVAGSNALVVCPSFEEYLDYPGEDQSYDQVLDFATFLKWAAAHNIDCNAFSWHEINTGPTAVDFNNQPEDITAHISRFRGLLAEYPSLAMNGPMVNGQATPTQLFVNEFGAGIPQNQTQAYYTMPGWIAGDIAALESGKIDQANRSCENLNACSDLLDDLVVVSNGADSQDAGYWVYYYYAQMIGTVGSVTTSEEQYNGFETTDSSTNTVRLLLGRHETQGTGNSSAQSVSVTFSLPWSSGAAAISVQDLPNGGGAESDPPITNSNGTVVNGQLTVSIPSFASEDGFDITVTP